MTQVRAGRVAVGTAALILAASTSWAQSRSTPVDAPDAGSTTSPAGGARLTRPSTSGGDRQTNSDNSVVRSPIFLSGKVVLEDGTPPPDPVVIECVCLGSARPESYTDSKGRFSFDLGRSNLVAIDAGVGASNSMRGPVSFARAASGPRGAVGITERDLADCALRASLAGYWSDTVSLAGRLAPSGEDVGTLILRPYARGEGVTVSLTSLAAPKEAAKALQRGREAAGKQKWDEARGQFEKAVRIHPLYASAWFELGKTLERLHDESGAWSAYQQAIASDQRFLPAYLQIANIELKRSNWAAAIETTDRILGLDPVNFPGVYIYRAIAQFSLRNLAAAEKSARQALDLDTAKRFPVANHVLGMILAQRGDLSGAAAHLRAYLQAAPNASNAPVARVQLARIQGSLPLTLSGAP